MVETRSYPNVITDLASWDQASKHDKQEAAISVLAKLPNRNRWKYLGLRRYTLGKLSRDMAVFRWNERFDWRYKLRFDIYTTRSHLRDDTSTVFIHNEFVLVPGGEAFLGYDPDDTKWITERILIECYGDLTGWDYPEGAAAPRPTVQQRLAALGPGLRVVSFPPTLVQTYPCYLTKRWFFKQENRERPVDLGDKDNLALVEQCRAEVGLWIAEDAFRLPTADEWELYYRGGTATRFPWGDEPPGGQWTGNDYSRLDSTPRIRAGFLNWESFFERPNLMGLIFPMDTPEWVSGSKPICFSGASSPSTISTAALYWLGCLPAAKHIFLWFQGESSWDGPFFAFRRVLPL